jgi:2-keto-3-deoxy-L-rhamnonate aldolase RhmA
MTAIRNSARERLAEGGVSIGLGVRLLRGVEVAKVARAAGFDWLFIDLEHGPMSLETASQISVAALDTGIAPIVRVPAKQYAMAARALDGGALGIVMPHVDTAEEAREIVVQLKYPPIGHRSVAGQQAHFDFRSVGIGELTTTLNAATLIVVMIETPMAVANADAIAAVPGVDAVMIGTNDLATELGIPGRFDDPQIIAAYETVIAACKRQGKWAGMGGVRDDAQLKRFIDMGVRMILAGAEVGMLIAAGSARTSYMRGCL